MIILTQTKLDLNSRIKLSGNGGDLCPMRVNFWSGNTMKPSVSPRQWQNILFSTTKDSIIFSQSELIKPKIYQIIAGYDGDDAADQLTNDPVMTKIIGTEALASPLSLSRFLNRFDTDSIDQLNQANQELLDRMHRYRDSDALVLDLDSTHADTHGDQEAANYNTHDGTVGFHPLIAFDGITGDFMKADLRPCVRAASIHPMGG